VYSSLQGCHTATGTHTPHGITQCYLPPGRGDIPALTPSRSWYSIKRPWRDARLSWPSGLVTYRDGIPARPVTHPGTNRARRGLTSFMRWTLLTTTPRRLCVRHTGGHWKNSEPHVNWFVYGLGGPQKTCTHGEIHIHATWRFRRIDFCGSCDAAWRYHYSSNLFAFIGVTVYVAKQSEPMWKRKDAKNFQEQIFQRSFTEYLHSNNDYEKTMREYERMRQKTRKSVIAN